MTRFVYTGYLRVSGNDIPAKSVTREYVILPEIHTHELSVFQQYTDKQSGVTEFSRTGGPESLANLRASVQYFVARSLWNVESLQVVQVSVNFVDVTLSEWRRTQADGTRLRGEEDGLRMLFTYFRNCTPRYRS